MGLVTETDLAGILYRKGYILGLVAPYTFLNLEGLFPVMACSAGFPFFHFSHCGMRTFLHIEYFTVTDLAIVVYGGLFQMKSVIEDDGSCILGCVGDVFDGDGLNCGCRQQQDKAEYELGGHRVLLAISWVYIADRL